MALVQEEAQRRKEAVVAEEGGRGGGGGGGGGGKFIQSWRSELGGGGGGGEKLIQGLTPWTRRTPSATALPRCRRLADVSTSNKKVYAADLLLERYGVLRLLGADRRHSLRVCRQKKKYERLLGADRRHSLRVRAIKRRKKKQKERRHSLRVRVR